MHPFQCLLALAFTSMAFATQAAERLYACGDDQVREYQVQAAAVTEIWRWSAADTKDLPASYRDKLLAELLPNGLIAVALSIDPKGDRLQLYDRQRNETPLFEVPLPSGHGVVWDNAHSRLLALSHDVLQSFALTGDHTAPTLKELEGWTLPGRRDGHDLSSLGDGRYWVTTDDGVWLFNPQNGAFSPFEPLGSSSRIKAVSVLGERMAWVEVEENWWAYGFHLANCDGSAAVRFPVNDLHLYKVRWIR